MINSTKSRFQSSVIAASAALFLGAVSPLAAELAAADRDQRLAAIAEDARNLQQDASGMELALRTKTPDLAAVRATLGEIEADIQTLNTDVQALESASPAWAAGSQSFQKMKEKAGILRAFALSKASLLDSPDAKKNRKILAAKAKGIALRAELLSTYASSGDAD